MPQNLVLEDEALDDRGLTEFAPRELAKITGNSLVRNVLVDKSRRLCMHEDAQSDSAAFSR